MPIIEAPVLPVSRKRKSLEQEKDTEQEKKPVSNRVPIERLYQGSHRLEKYLNIQDCLEKSLKIKFVLKKP